MVITPRRILIDSDDQNQLTSSLRISGRNGDSGITPKESVGIDDGVKLSAGRGTDVFA